MNYWTREIGGWLLVVLGLVVFYRCYGLLTDGNHYVIEAGTLAFVGVFLFRGGIHLLKVAVAAQICLQTREAKEPVLPAVPPGGERRRPASRPGIPVR